MKRREFIKRVAQTTAVVSTTALSTSRAFGANERVGIGVIGCGLIGRIHTRSFVSLPGAQVVAVADTYQPRLDAAQMVVGGGAKLKPRLPGEPSSNTSRSLSWKWVLIRF